MPDDQSSDPAAPTTESPRQPAWAVLYIAATLALLLGIYARLKGLGAAPIEADEYYILRSVQNILRVGVPEYACGGYYPRGLAYQYLVTLLAFTGMQLEVAARLAAALGGLLCL